MALAEIELEDFYEGRRCFAMDNISDETIAKLFLQAKHLKGLSELTIQSYEMELNKFLGFIHGMGKTLLQLKPADVRLYLASKPNLKPTSIGRKIAVLKSLYRFLVNEEYTDVNIMDKVETPKLPKHLPKFLTLEEIEQVRDACNSIRDRALIEMLYSTGMRLSELWALNRDDIQWEHRKIIITGKGNKQRVVQFSERAEMYLKKYLESRKYDNPALFLSQRGCRLGKRAIQHIVRRQGEKANLKKRVHPHLYRHTLASQAVQHGVDIQTVSTILGHSSISTTQIYSHLTDDFIDEQYKKIPT